jgi:hypothetical protein
MKSASAATIALLALNQYLMAELYTITLLNGTVLRYTDADGDLLSSLGGNVNQSGTAQGGSTSSLTLSAAASSTPDAYANKAVRITGGTGAGQERNVQTSRKNWLPISASIGGTGWGNIDCTITLNAAAAPDGTMSSSLIGDADATSAPSLVANGGYTSFPAGTQVSDSIFSIRDIKLFRYGRYRIKCKYLVVRRGAINLIGRQLYSDRGTRLSRRRMVQIDAGAHYCRRRCIIV